MLDGHNRDRWNHTSHVLAMLYNAHKAPRTRPLKPDAFHPYAPRPQPRPVTLAQLAALGVLRPKPQE